jgi:hypothetical protein
MLDVATHRGAEVRDPWPARVPDDVAVWYATGVRADVVGDRETVVRSVDWLERLDPDGGWTDQAAARLALEVGLVERARAALTRAEARGGGVGSTPLWARLRAAEGAADATDRWIAAASEDPSWWPEAWVAARTEGARARTLTAWAAVVVPRWQREARGKAALEVGDHRQALDDLAAAMDWAPSPEVLRAWAGAGVAACRLAGPWEWVVGHRVTGWEVAWREAVAELARVSGDPVLTEALGLPPSAPACPAKGEVEARWQAHPADPALLQAVAGLLREQGSVTRADRLEAWARARQAADPADEGP